MMGMLRKIFTQKKNVGHHAPRSVPSVYADVSSYSSTRALDDNTVYAYDEFDTSSEKTGLDKGSG